MMESQSTIRDALMRCGSGTLILDGVSDLSPAAQLRLLHILGSRATKTCVWSQPLRQIFWQMFKMEISGMICFFACLAYS